MQYDSIPPERIARNVLRELEAALCAVADLVEGDQFDAADSCLEELRTATEIPIAPIARSRVETALRFLRSRDRRACAHVIGELHEAVIVRLLDHIKRENAQRV